MGVGKSPEKAEIIKVDKFADITQETGFNNKQIEVLKNTVFNTLKTESQVILALMVAKKYDLNPFAKEFYAWLDNKGKLISIASASGFMKIARKQPGFISIEANAVYKGEKFSMNTGTGKVSHEIDPTQRGKDKKPLGAYARLKMEGKEDVVKWVDWSDYTNDHVAFASPWKKQKSSMIEKCGITVVLRSAFGLSGLYGEEETENQRGNGKDMSNEVDKKALSEGIEAREKAILNK